MRIAIYARYSTDQQDKTSISGQVSNCEALAAQSGWSVVQTYADEALSGSDDSRPAYQQLLADSERGLFDGIVVDETSRLTRRAGELPRLLDILQFRNQFLMDVKGFDSRQETASLLASIYGGIDSLELRKIRERTHRGLRERAKGGYSAGGKTYGYSTVPVDPADPESKKIYEIVDTEATIVREIFQSFADGDSARAIANELNRRGVPSPGASWKRTKRRTKGWTQSAIVGTAAQFTGILRRDLYVGRMVWNRRRSKKVPGSSKRIYEMRPESEWTVTDVPELRIIDDLLWRKVQARLQHSRDTTHPNNLRKRGRPSRYLLSGIMVCECGANYIMADSRAYACASHTNSGEHLCDNNLRVRRDIAETVLLANVKDQLLAGDVLKYVEGRFREAVEKLASGADTADLEADLASTHAKIEKIVDAIAEIGVSNTLTTRLRKLERSADELEQRLAETTVERESLDTLPDLLPALMQRWRQLVENIESLATNPLVDPSDIETARKHLQALLGTVELRPRDDVLWAYPTLNAKGLVEPSPLHINLVAGAGFEPATFGL